MVIINKIREHFKTNSISIELEQDLSDGILTFPKSEIEYDYIDNIYIKFNCEASLTFKDVFFSDHLQPPERHYGTPFIEVEFLELYLGDTEIRLNNQQIFILESILQNAIEV